jgi:hypothetical protein
MINKQFYYKIYDRYGSYLTTWSTEVANTPSFKMVLNSGLGELKIRLARPMGDYGENEDVNFNNEVRLYVIDKEAPNGTLIYSGYISDYQPTLGSNSEEFVEITVIGYVTTLEDTTFIDTNGNTAKVYSAEDPSDMIKSVLNLYNWQGGIITAGNIDSVGVYRDYTFNNITNQQAIDKIREICPPGWNWFVGADNQLEFHFKDSTSKHTFVIGKHLTSLEAFKTVRDVKNAVRFIGGIPPYGSQLYKVYEDAESISLYGRREYVMIDKSVISEETADAMANSYLESSKDPFLRATITILDNNGDDQECGYDIESIKPGDTCEIIDPNFAYKKIGVPIGSQDPVYINSLGPETVTNGGFIGGTTGWVLQGNWSYGENNVIYSV